MSQNASLLIEPLASHHERQGFDSGNSSLNTYLKRQAKQDIKRRISRVFVLTDCAAPSVILGYYTLSTIAIKSTDLPKDLACKLPRHPIPAALLGRLAITQIAQGQNFGRLLLANAVRRTLNVSDEIGIYALVVDAIDNNARSFYERFGFSLLQQTGRRLFLPLKTL